MPKVHAICCQKGGVGKTTITVNLGAMVNDVLSGDDENSPVLVVGTDPQRSMDWWANRVGDNIPFDYTEARDERALSRLHTIDSYDHIFVDTPGSLEDEDILTQVLKQADDALVPITPEPLSFVPADTTINRLIKPLGLAYRVVVNLWDPRDGRADLEDTMAFILQKGWPCAKTVVRRYKVHTRAAAEGLVCTQYPKNRVSMEAREDILRLALELGYGGR